MTFRTTNYTLFLGGRESPVQPLGHFEAVLILMAPLLDCFVPAVHRKNILAAMASRLARISHTIERIGAPNQRKLLCHNDVSLIRGAPRCRHSVAQNGLILESWRATLWKQHSMADW